jgi:hypothetical protein
MWKQPSSPDLEYPGPTSDRTKTVWFSRQLFGEEPATGLVLNALLMCSYMAVIPFLFVIFFCGNIDLLLHFLIGRARSSAAVSFLPLCFCGLAAGVTPIAFDGKGYSLSTLLDSSSASWRQFELPENGGVMSPGGQRLSCQSLCRCCFFPSAAMALPARCASPIGVRIRR